MIAIVTDSTAYLTRAEAEAFQVRVLPHNYSLGEEKFEESYVDDNGNFLPLVAEHALDAATSQTHTELFVKTFSELVASGYEVLCVVLSTKLSRVYRNAQAAALQVDAARIRVMDSTMTGGALYMMVMEAAKRAKQGEDMETIVAALEALRMKIGVRFSVDDLSSLRKSRRLSVVRRAGTILNLTPILKMTDGAVIYETVARGNSERVRKLLQMIPEDAQQIIVQAMQPSDLLTLLEETVKRRFPNAQCETRMLGPVLQIHLGTRGAGVIWR